VAGADQPHTMRPGHSGPFLRRRRRPPAIARRPRAALPTSSTDSRARDDDVARTLARRIIGGALTYVENPDAGASVHSADESPEHRRYRRVPMAPGAERLGSVYVPAYRMTPSSSGQDRPFVLRALFLRRAPVSSPAPLPGRRSR